MEFDHFDLRKITDAKLGDGWIYTYVKNGEQHRFYIFVNDQAYDIISAVVWSTGICLNLADNKTHFIPANMYNGWSMRGKE